MQIILVPGSARRRARCLNAGSVVLAIVTFLVVVPVAVSLAGYRYGVSQATYEPSPEQLRLAYVQTNLENSRREIGEIENAVEQQLDTLGIRLGQLQVHMSRVNAVGKRLADMASLETEEFDFDLEPGVGGPASDLSHHQTPAELVSLLESLERSVDAKREEMEILEILLMDRELHARHFPHGWPVEEGWISSGFGYRNDPFTGKRAFHAGVDIAGKTGLPIMAVADGVVTVSATKSGYGVMVEVNHGKGYVTRYAHALVSMVEVGDRVKKGDIIAVMGSTGRSTGAHVHFEVSRDGKVVNPRKYIRASL